MDPYGYQYCNNPTFSNNAIYPNYVAHIQPLINKTIYINQHFNNKLPSKVLINPNFKPLKERTQVHVNPNYIKPKNIFVNPQVLAAKTIVNPVNVPIMVAPNIINTCQTNTTSFKQVQTKAAISTKTKWVRADNKPIAIINKPYSITNKDNYKFNKPSIVIPQISPKRVVKCTKYKIIRKSVSPIVKRKRRTSLIQRYKVIRTNGANFKIDNRNSEEKLQTKLRTKQYLLNKAYRMRIDHRSSILKWTNNKAIVNKTENRRKSVTNQKIMSRTLNISGVKYKMDNNRMVLKMAGIKEVKIIRNNSKMAGRNIKLRKLKKNNIPCLTYRRFGECQRHLRGMCNKVHNPNQVSLCTKFLQGACRNDNCQLSHKVSPEKMATCKFFLEGICSKENCPYLHVKINSTADICKDFLEGFCNKAKECDKRHQFLCPDFEKSGKCQRIKCPYPHGRTVRKYTCNTVFVKSAKLKNVAVKKPAKKIKPVVSQNLVRYYQESDQKSPDNNQKSLENNQKSPESNNKLIIKLTYDDTNIIKLSSDVTPDSSSNIKAKRPKLGTLPTFIPFK